MLSLAHGAAAVVKLTKSLAQEFGPSGIRVNAVSPGPAALTMMLASFRNDFYDPTTGHLDEITVNDLTPSGNGKYVDSRTIIDPGSQTYNQDQFPGISDPNAGPTPSLQSSPSEVQRHAGGLPLLLVSDWAPATPNNIAQATDDSIPAGYTKVADAH